MPVSKFSTVFSSNLATKRCWNGKRDRTIRVAPFQSQAQPFVACSTEKRGGPGTFPHVSDIKGRKTVERPKMNVGVLGLRTGRYQVTYHMYLASGRQLSYSLSVECVDW